MEIEVTDATTLPEWLQGHVKDGKLNLGAIPAPEDVGGLKSALQKERGNVAAYAKYGTPDEIDAKIVDLTEKAKGGGKGAEDAQAKLDAMATEYDGKLTAANERIHKMQQRTAQSELKTELAKAGFIAEAIDDIAATAMGRLKFTDEGAAQVMTSDGKPMIGNGADHGATFADLAKELADAKPYAVRDAGKGGGGKPPGSQGGTPDKTITRSQFDGMSPPERSKFLSGGGSVSE